MPTLRCLLTRESPCSRAGRARGGSRDRATKVADLPCLCLDSAVMLNGGLKLGHPGLVPVDLCLFRVGNVAALFGGAVHQRFDAVAYFVVCGGLPAEPARWPGSERQLNRPVDEQDRSSLFPATWFRRRLGGRVQAAESGRLLQAEPDRGPRGVRAMCNR